MKGLCSHKMNGIEHKQWQLEVIQQTNPAPEANYTWIRTIDDVLTFEEALQDSDWCGWEHGNFDPDYSGADAKTALHTGIITVYSSHHIKPGVFVTTSKMKALSYSGNGWVDQMHVCITDIAWIDPTQGQYTGPMPE